MPDVQGGRRMFRPVGWEGFHWRLCWYCSSDAKPAFSSVGWDVAELDENRLENRTTQPTIEGAKGGRGKREAS